MGTQSCAEPGGLSSLWLTVLDLFVAYFFKPRSTGSFKLCLRCALRLANIPRVRFSPSTLQPWFPTASTSSLQCNVSDEHLRRVWLGSFPHSFPSPRSDSTRIRYNAKFLTRKKASFQPGLVLCGAEALKLIHVIFRSNTTLSYMGNICKAWTRQGWLRL